MTSRTPTEASLAGLYRSCIDCLNQQDWEGLGLTFQMPLSAPPAWNAVGRAAFEGDVNAIPVIRDGGS